MIDRIMIIFSMKLMMSVSYKSEKQTISTVYSEIYFDRAGYGSMKTTLQDA